MAQTLPRFCPQCGTPTRANMHHCATCGLPVEVMLSRPDTIQAGPGERKDVTYQDSMPEPATVPIPGYTQQADQQSPLTGSPRQQDGMSTWNASLEEPRAPQFFPAAPVPQRPEGWNASAPPLNNPGSQVPWAAPIEPMQPPRYTPAPQPKKRRRTGIVLVLLLLLLLALGGGGYLALSVLGLHIPGLSGAQSTIKTTRMNLAINYAGIDITLLNVQQAQNFTDDPQTATDGMLRLNLQEQNKTTVPIGGNYDQSARLLVRGKPGIAPTYVKSNSAIAPGVTRTNTIDFSVANGGSLGSMIFQLGTSNEAQMQIPLAGQADLSQYQPKATAQNGTTVYFGLNWTLTDATTSLNTPGQQATRGMEYLTLDLAVDNTLSQEAISGSPFDYLRVQVGGKTIAPVSTTLPVSFATGETGKKGTATFLVPQSSAAFTLILLSQDPGASGQASIDFQVG